MSDEPNFNVVMQVVEHAARIAADGNGLPLETFRTLACHALEHLVSVTTHRGGVYEQDVDYLARLFQSAYQHEVQALPRYDHVENKFGPDEMQVNTRGAWVKYADIVEALK